MALVIVIAIRHGFQDSRRLALVLDKPSDALGGTALILQPQGLSDDPGQGLGGGGQKIMGLMTCHVQLIYIKDCARPEGERRVKVFMWPLGSELAPPILG